jgi:hypothetical protein
MSVACNAVRLAVVGLDVGEVLPAPLDTHLSCCLRCQVEMVRHTKLERELASLRHAVETAPPSVVDSVAAGIVLGIDPEDEASLNLARVVAATGALVAAAGTVAVVRWMRTRSVA